LVVALSIVLLSCYDDRVCLLLFAVA